MPAAFASARSMTRRDWLAASSLLVGSGVLAAAPVSPTSPAPPTSPAATFRLCLNTATIRGHKLSLEREVEIAAKAGFDAIEPWLDNLDRFVGSGGSLDELRRRIADAGLTVEGAIGFAPWCVDDATQRAKGLEQAKRDMEMVALRHLRGGVGVDLGVAVVQRLDLRRKNGCCRIRRWSSPT